jgi:ABC-type phosphate transport system ATPase subunit
MLGARPDLDRQDRGEEATCVTSNMQPAARVTDFTTFMYLSELIEFDSASNMFTAPGGLRTPGQQTRMTVK